MKFLEKYKNAVLYLFIAFMIVQPLFDIYFLYLDGVIELFKFSPSTIIRMIVMSFLFLCAFIWYKNKRKYKILLGISAIYIIYIIFHHFNSLIFSVPYGNFDNYSTLKELFYMIRMIMPLLMIFVTYQFKIKWEHIRKIVILVCLLFSFTMIITNIFEVALTSYSDGNKIIEFNIFKWFIPNIYEEYSYLVFASKGLFHMANQVSGILICLFPILIYIYFKRPTIINSITLISTILAMIMLGTRVASYGWVIVSIIMLILFFVFAFVKKEIKFTKRVIITYIIIILSFSILMPFSPVMNRIYINDNEKLINKQIKDSDADKLFKKFMKEIKQKEKKAKTKEQLENIKKEKSEFLYKSFYTFGIDEKYILELYPYDEDVDFWLNEYKIPFKNRANHRQLKTDITKRIIELNENNYDYLVGMSFTRLRNAQVYMENDIYVHLFSIGIFGIIFYILPYFLILCYVMYHSLKNSKSNINFLNTTLLFSVLLVFASGIMSGNIFDEWIVTLFLGMLCGYLLLNLKLKEQ